MKPTLEACLAACPGTDARLPEEHLSRLNERYFELFSREEIFDHIRRHTCISAEHPLELIMEKEGDQGGSCTIIAFDYPGVFSLITGVLAGTGFSISSGDVFTYARKTEKSESSGKKKRTSKTGKRAPDPFRRRRIISRFSGSLAGKRSFESWAEDLQQRMGDVFSLMEMGDPASRELAGSRVNELVVSRLAHLKVETLPVLYPVLMEVDNESEEATRLKISSEDTPAFLYALTHAFSLHGIVIEQVKIRTESGRIRDEISIVDAGNRKIEDPNALSRIKLSVLLTKQFTYFLGTAPDPNAALYRFKNLVEDVVRLPGKDEWLDTLSDPHTLKDLARLLGTSDILWEDFIRLQLESLLPMLKPLVKNRRFSQPEETLLARLDQALEGAKSMEEERQRLNRIKDQEIFSIDLDHILGTDTDFADLARRLTQLAEAVVNKAAELAHRHLVTRFGRPETAAGLEAGYAIVGLGKLGGAALGYASDIEFLLVYADKGSTSGPETIPNAEFFNRLVQTMARLIEAKREGIFQVDLRLRPHGNAGPLAVSLEAFCDYYGTSGQAHSYERLALVRLRAIGGDPALGARIERLRDEMIYSSRNISIEELRALRLKQFQEKTERGKQNAKFSPGGLVDLEYNIQILQVLNGKETPRVRTPILHDALAALADSDILKPEETGRLFAAYDFLRNLINAMRMLRGSARDLVLPSEDSPEFVHLARRMGYGGGKPLGPAQQLRIDYGTHTAAVRVFAERTFGKDALPGPATVTLADLVLSDSVPMDLAAPVLSAAGFQNLARAYTNIQGLAGNGARRNTFAKLSFLAFDVLRQTPDPDMALNNWERFIHSRTSPEFHYRLLLQQPMRLEVLLNIFAGSQFLADTLIRYPGFLDWVIMPENLQSVLERSLLEEELNAPSHDPLDHGKWLNQIRRLRRREILRIGTRDMALKVPTGEIMQELSVLAETLSAAALKGVFARREQKGDLPADADALESSFCLLAFGKLGGSELNYSSDIDLLGIFSPMEDPEIKKKSGTDRLKRFYSSIMEQVGQDLSRHTELGYAYRVDLRLRPWGRAGELVPALPALAAYYQNEASPWEIQAALKIRPVAGNMELGNEFLSRIRPILLRRRDREEVARSVEEMRKSAVKKTSRLTRSSTDVKSGAGGIRDVEFLVQGLQLVHAHEHPDLLCANTLTALERLGERDILPGEAVGRLRQDYIFLRRVEHCLQILEDRQIHTLPRNPAELTALAKRILGPGADASTFMEEMEACRKRVRREYEKHLFV